MNPDAYDEYAEAVAREAAEEMQALAQENPNVIWLWERGPRGR